MAFWNVKIESERGYDPNVDFFTSETGERTYSLFGLKLFTKKFNVKTKQFIVNKDSKSGIGFGVKK